MNAPENTPPAVRRPLLRSVTLAGLALTGFGALASLHHDGGRDLGFAWLLAFLFYLMISLGALFLLLLHHLTSASWSVGLRRIYEHLASLLFPHLAVLFLPVIFFAPKIYGWLRLDPATNNVLAARQPVFTYAGFVITSAVFFGVWWLLTSCLKYWSLRQDQTGAAECTHRLRRHSVWGVVALGLTLTGAGILWLQSVDYLAYSAIYGVYFFSSSVWVALAAVYLLAVGFKPQRGLAAVLPERTFYSLGVLLLAFTLFQGYAEFTQYFVVWNANLPVETFWYIARARGSWFWVSLILIFGHCFLPFFVLLSARVKTNFKILVPLCLWIGVMHVLDLMFNLLPALHPEGFPWRWLALYLGCLLLMGSFLARMFLKNFYRHAPFPQRDPRLLEAMGVNANIANDLAAANTGGAQ